MAWYGLLSSDLGNLRWVHQGRSSEEGNGTSVFALKAPCWDTIIWLGLNGTYVKGKEVKCSPVYTR